MGDRVLLPNLGLMKDELKLFVYGSLKMGECNDHVIKDWVMSSEPATLKGRMYLRPDEYPALFLSGLGTLGSSNYEQDLKLDTGMEPLEGSVISGQLLGLSSAKEALKVLDHFEGYFPGQESEYLRVAVKVGTKSGNQNCWTYVGAGEPGSSWPELENWPPPGLNRAPEPYSHGLS